MSVSERTESDSLQGWSVVTWPRRIYDWVLHWAETPYALVALVILSFSEASFFPVPPDVLLIAMCLGARKQSLWFALVCTAASIVGGLAGYAIGHFVWENVDQYFYGYVPGFTPEAFTEIQGAYNEWGVLVVFTAGFSPIPFKIFTITSGVMGQSLGGFVVAAAVGRAARFFLVAGLIYRYGEPIKEFIDRRFNLLAVVFTVLLVGGFVVIKWMM